MSRIPRIAGPCPYLENAPPWRVLDMFSPRLDAALYESMLVEAWRRSGLSFYRPVCAGCSLCIPIRIDAERFAPTPSQRRAMGRNADLRVEAAPIAWDEERFALYERYRVARHGQAPAADIEGARKAYAAFLVADPLGSSLAVDYRLDTREAEGGRLLASGYVDVLPEGLSSVYFTWDLPEAKRSLGVFSVAAEIALARKLGKRWYYLGFWVPGAPTMDYKADFAPAEVALDGVWRPLDALTRAALETESRP